MERKNKAGKQVQDGLRLLAEDAPGGVLSLPCEVFPGILTGERGVAFELRGRTFFSFVPESDVEISPQTAQARPSQGRLLVRWVNQGQGKVLLCLPRATLNSTDTIQVMREDILKVVSG